MADKKDELNQQLQRQIFELGRKTYVYEAERRMAVDAIAQTANQVAELTKKVEGKIDAAAAPKTGDAAEPTAPAGDSAGTPATTPQGTPDAKP